MNSGRFPCLACLAAKPAVDACLAGRLAHQRSAPSRFPCLPAAVKSVLSEYRIHNADVHLKQVCPPSVPASRQLQRRFSYPAWRAALAMSQFSLLWRMWPATQLFVILFCLHLRPACLSPCCCPMRCAFLDALPAGL